MIYCNVFGSIPDSVSLVQAVCRKMWAEMWGSSFIFRSSRAAVARSDLLYASTTFFSIKLTAFAAYGFPGELRKTKSVIPSISFLCLVPSTRESSFCFIRLFLALAVSGMSRRPASVFKSCTWNRQPSPRLRYIKLLADMYDIFFQIHVRPPQAC